MYVSERQFDLKESGPKYFVVAERRNKWKSGLLSTSWNPLKDVLFCGPVSWRFKWWKLSLEWSWRMVSAVITLKRYAWNWPRPGRRPYYPSLSRGWKNFCRAIQRKECRHYADVQSRSDVWLSFSKRKPTFRVARAVNDVTRSAFIDGAGGSKRFGLRFELVNARQPTSKGI